MRNSIKVNILVSATILYSTQLLSGCSGNVETEFLEKLKAEVDKEAEHCYNVDSTLSLELLKDQKGDQFLSVMSGSVMNFHKEKQARGRKMLEVLDKAGYVEMSDTPTKMKYNFQMYDGFKLTEKGRENINWDKGVCAGKRDVTEIVEYTEPSDLGGMTFTEVTYNYDMNFNNVVSDLNLEEAFRKKLPGSDKAVFIKTNKGWRLK